MDEKTKNKKIYEEFLRIGLLYEGITENKFAVIFPLIRDAAFMRITLDELSATINRTGAIEEYKNGADQFGMKQSAALQSYNNVIKVYSSTLKQLFSYLPLSKEQSLSVQEKWRRERMDPEELEEVLAEERKAAAKSSAEWIAKLKAAYGKVK